MSTTKEQLIEINRIMNRYNKIGFKNINKKDYYTLAEYYLDLIYDSGLSLFDYSFYNYIPFPYINYQSKQNLIWTFEKIDKEKTVEILSREDKTKEQAEKIIQEIRDNNLDIIDYYKKTKLSSLFFNENFASYKRSPIINNLYTDLRSDKTTLEKEVKIVYYSGNIKVSQELKELAFKELEEQNLPLTNATYRALVRRRINKEENMI